MIGDRIEHQGLKRAAVAVASREDATPHSAANEASTDMKAAAHHRRRQRRQLGLHRLETHSKTVAALA